MTLYPEMTISDEGHCVTYTTTLRKKYRGKWYLISFAKEFGKSENFNRDLALISFNKEVYIMLISGKVYLKAVYGLDKTSVFKLDPDQTEETERLKKMYQ